MLGFCFFLFFSFHLLFSLAQKKHLCRGKMLHCFLLREKEPDSLALLRDRKITLSGEYSKEMK